MKAITKFIIILIADTMVFLSPALAVDLVFQWDPVVDPGLQTYRIYQAERQGDVSGPWIKIGETTETTFTYTLPSNRSYIFCATAVYQGGEESFISNVAIFRWRGGPPGGLRW